MINTYLFINVSSLQYNRGEMLVIGSIGKTLRLKTNSTAPRICCAVHAGESRQIVAGIHDKSRFCGVDIQSASAGRTYAGSGIRKFVQCRLFQNEAMVVTMSVEQLHMLLINTFTNGMIATEVKRSICYRTDLSGMIGIRIGRQIEIGIDLHKMIFNGSSRIPRTRKIKIGMVCRSKESILICLCFIIYAECILFGQRISHLNHDISWKARLPVRIRIPEKELILELLLCLPYDCMKTIIPTMKRIRNRIKRHTVIFPTYTKGALQYTSGYRANSSSYIIVSTLSAGFFECIAAYNYIPELTMTIGNHNG